MEDRDAQQDEILAIQSIFDESQIHIDSSGNNISGCIFIKPEISDSITLQAVKNEQLHSFTVCATRILCKFSLFHNTINFIVW